jgi:hypothetical protein
VNAVLATQIKPKATRSAVLAMAGHAETGSWVFSWDMRGFSSMDRAGPMRIAMQRQRMDCRGRVG